MKRVNAYCEFRRRMAHHALSVAFTVLLALFSFSALVADAHLTTTNKVASDAPVVVPFEWGQWGNVASATVARTAGAQAILVPQLHAVVLVGGCTQSASTSSMASAWCAEATSNVTLLPLDDEFQNNRRYQTMSPTSWGIVGPHATVLVNKTTLVVFRSCMDDAAWSGGAAARWDATPEVGTLSLDNKDHSWVPLLPSDHSSTFGFGDRTRASCILEKGEGSSILIIGGVHRTTNASILTIDRFHISKGLYEPNVASLEGTADPLAVAMASPLSVAALDGETIVALVPQVNNASKALLWSYSASSTQNCTNTFLPIVRSVLHSPHNERLASGIAVFGSTITILSADTTVTIALPLIPPQHTSEQQQWTVVSHPGNGVLYSAILPVISFTAVQLYRYGGFEAADGPIVFHVPPVASSQTSVNFFALAIGSTSTVSTDTNGVVQFAVNDGTVPWLVESKRENVSTWASLATLCGPDVLSSPCIARLTMDEQCSSIAPGTLQAVLAFSPSQRTTQAVFQLSAALSNVFVCLSFGGSNELWRTCSGSSNHNHDTAATSSSRYYPMNLNAPLQIVYQGPTPAPPPMTRAPGDGNTEDGLSPIARIALYACAGVAFVAILIALIALARRMSSSKAAKKAPTSNSDEGALTPTEKRALLAAAGTSGAGSSSDGRRSTGQIAVARPQPRRGGGGRDSSQGDAVTDSETDYTPRGDKDAEDTSLIVGHGTYTLERYRILRRLGEGSFSVVYLVERKADGLLFALKHLECGTDESRHDAMQECELIRSLQGHPNVIMLYDMYMNYEFGSNNINGESVSPPPPQPKIEAKATATTTKQQQPAPKKGKTASAATEWIDFADDDDTVETQTTTTRKSTASTATTSLLPPRPVSPQPTPRTGRSEAPPVSPTAASQQAAAAKQPNRPSRHMCLVTQFHPLGDLKRWTLQQGQQGPAHRYLGRSSTPTTTPRSLTPRPTSNVGSYGAPSLGSAGLLASQRFAPLNASEVVLTSIAFQIMSVLHTLHHEQDPPILHRDLKPENILLVDPAHPVLTTSVLDELSVLSVQEGGYAPHPVRSPRTAMTSSTSASALAKSPTGNSILNSTQAAGPSGLPRAPPPPQPQQNYYPIEFLPIVVTDFGLARMIDTDDPLTQGAGTLPYVAPECLTKGGRYSTPCDMWSLGCVLFAVATRRVRGDNVRLLSQEVTTTPLASFQTSIAAELLPLGISKHFLRFLFLLLQPDPMKRLTAEQGKKFFRRYGDRMCLGRRRVAFFSKRGPAGGCIFDTVVQQAIPIRRGPMLIQYPPHPVPQHQTATGGNNNNNAAQLSGVQAQVSDPTPQTSPTVRHARYNSLDNGNANAAQTANMNSAGSLVMGYAAAPPSPAGHHEFVTHSVTSFLDLGAPSTRSTLPPHQRTTSHDGSGYYSTRRDSGGGAGMGGSNNNAANVYLEAPGSTRTSTATMYTCCDDEEESSPTYMDTISDEPSEDES